MKQTSHLVIVCGTVLVLAPIVHNLITLAMVAHLLALDPKGNYHLNGSLSGSYEGWCLFLGMCLFIVGVVFAFLDRRAEVRSVSVVTHRLPQESNA